MRNRYSLPNHIAIFTQQVSHYHDARYKAACTCFQKVSIITASSDADFPELLAEDGERPYEVTCLYESVDDYRAATLSGRLTDEVFKTLNRLDPDAIAVAGWSCSESFAAMLWAKSKHRAIIMFSESQSSDAKRSVFREYMKKRVVSAADSALVGALPHEEYIVKLGMRREFVFHGYDAVDNEHFCNGSLKAQGCDVKIRKDLRLPKKFILVSCRFIPKKNLDRLLIAFSRAIAIGFISHDLVILGDGPSIKHLRSLVDELNVTERVHFKGFRAYNVLPSFYGLADGFVHVSTAEQWGLVINEAAAAGLPIIASSACGAASALVDHGRNGWIVDAYDVNEIAERIVELATLSREARASMAKASKDIVAAWGPDRFASGLQSAVLIADKIEHQPLRAWDQLLFKMLARSVIQKIS